jgi:hypothetical protein
MIFILWFSSPYLIQLLFSLIADGHLAESKLLDKIGDKGTFGDMYGAVNALFSALAFWGVVVTILLQQHELRLTRVEMQRQRMEMKSSVAALKATSDTGKINLLTRALENELRLTMKAIELFQSGNIDSEYFSDPVKGLRQTRAWADFLNIRIQYIAGVLDDNGANAYLKKSFAGKMMQEFWEAQGELFKVTCGSERDHAFYLLAEKIALEAAGNNKESQNISPLENTTDGSLYSKVS